VNAIPITGPAQKNPQTFPQAKELSISTIDYSLYLSYTSLVTGAYQISQQMCTEFIVIHACGCRGGARYVRCEAAKIQGTASVCLKKGEKTEKKKEKCPTCTQKDSNKK
jgi:hypothetical protein